MGGRAHSQPQAGQEWTPAQGRYPVRYPGYGPSTTCGRMLWAIVSIWCSSLHAKPLSTFVVKLYPCNCCAVVSKAWLASLSVLPWAVRCCAAIWTRGTALPCIPSSTYRVFASHASACQNILLCVSVHRTLTAMLLYTSAAHALKLSLCSVVCVIHHCVSCGPSSSVWPDGSPDWAARMSASLLTCC